MPKTGFDIDLVKRIISLHERCLCGCQRESDISELEKTYVFKEGGVEFESVVG